MKKPPSKPLKSTKDIKLPSCDAIRPDAAAEPPINEAQEEQQMLAYVLSHDLRAPIRRLEYGHHGLSRMEGLPEGSSEYLAMMDREIQRLHKLQKALLEYVRLDADPALSAPVAMKDAWREAQTQLATKIRKRKAKISQDPLPELYVNAPRMARLFACLLENALTYTRSRPFVHLSVRPADGMWEFRMQDNGIGVAPENAEVIFSFGQRLHTDDEFEGIGAGLALAKKIVSRYGGRLWVEPAEEGSIFCFTLPGGPAQEGAQPVTEERTASSTPLSILVVEDSASDAAALRQVLARGEKADTLRLNFVTRLKQAMEFLERAHVDAVVLDLNLPDARGIGGLQLMQARFPETPIIVLSGQDDTRLAHSALQSGARDVLTKGETNGASLRSIIHRHALGRVS